MTADSLTLPAFPHKLTARPGAAPLIWDAWRRRDVVCTPEEWVRQHALHYLSGHLGYPAGLLSVERSTGKLAQRTDIRAYDPAGQPALLIECKAPTVRLTPAVLAQAQRYWLRVPARFVVLTNGIQHHCWRVGPPVEVWNRWPHWDDVTAG